MKKIPLDIANKCAADAAGAAMIALLREAERGQRNQESAGNGDDLQQIFRDLTDLNTRRRGLRVDAPEEVARGSDSATIRVPGLPPVTIRRREGSENPEIPPPPPRYTHTANFDKLVKQIRERERRASVDSANAPTPRASRPRSMSVESSGEHGLPGSSGTSGVPRVSVSDVNRALLQRVANHLRRSFPERNADETLRHLERGAQEAVRLIRYLSGERAAEESSSRLSAQGFVETQFGIAYVVGIPEQPPPVFSSVLGSERSVSSGVSLRARRQMGREAHAAYQEAQARAIRAHSAQMHEEMIRWQSIKVVNPDAAPPNLRRPTVPRPWIQANGRFVVDVDPLSLRGAQPHASSRGITRCGEHHAAITIYGVGEVPIACIAVRVLSDYRVYSVPRCGDCARYNLGAVITDFIPEGTWLNPPEGLELPMELITREEPEAALENSNEPPLAACGLVPLGDDDAPPSASFVGAQTQLAEGDRAPRGAWTIPVSGSEDQSILLTIVPAEDLESGALLVCRVAVRDENGDLFFIP